MKISVLASGSKGNCSFVENDNTRLLIDLGMPCDYVENKLKEIDVDPNSISAILVTHTHADHINGLVKFYKKYKPFIYIMPKMESVMKEYLGDANYKYFDEDTLIDDCKVHIIKTSHDVRDSVGFIIDEKLVYITDTGYLNQRYFKVLENKEVYILESNHDVMMLMNGKYPYQLKQRILSDKGHLSNEYASKHLSKFIGDKTKCVILAHLSEENNTPEVALSTLLSCVDGNKIEKILIANQHDRTELIEIK